MKLFLFVFFLFFYPLFSHSQEDYSHSTILVKNIANLDQSGWSFFSDKENIKEYIDLRKESFGSQGFLPLVISYMNFDKEQLIQLEQELALYKHEKKQGLSSSDIAAAEEAIKLHWAAIRSVEDQIRSVGFGDASPLIGKVGDYREGVWELYQADRAVVLSLVDKKDKNLNLYKQLNRNDEVYAEIIAPSVERYMSNMKVVAKAYSSDSWESPVGNLEEMYRNSSEISNCFNKNFKNPTGDHQQDLLSTIQSWHTEQGNLGAEIFINAYKNNEMEPVSTIEKLEIFRDAPDVVKERIGFFLREEFLNNEAFIQTENEERIRTRTEALIGLKDFDILSAAEEKIFNEAFEEGIIVNPFVDYRGYYYTTDRPLPEIVIPE